MSVSDKLLLHYSTLNKFNQGNGKIVKSYQVFNVYDKLAHFIHNVDC